MCLGKGEGSDNWAQRFCGSREAISNLSRGRGGGGVSLGKSREGPRDWTGGGACGRSVGTLGAHEWGLLGQAGRAGG